MPPPTTSIGLSPTIPAPPTGNQNVFPQSDGGQPLQKISFYPQKATTSLLGVVVPDNTSITVDGTGKISAAIPTGVATQAGVQDETYTYSADTGTANAYAQTLTPTPTVIAGLSGKFKALHGNTGASTFTVAGTTAPLVKNGTQPLASGDIAVGQIIGWTYDGANFQTGGIAPATTLIPVIRGSSVGSTASASSVVIPLPTGSLAGDFALLCASCGFSVSVPSGWTSVFLINGLTNDVVIASKILTSGDITTGSVTVTSASAYNWIPTMVTFVGATGGVREVHSNNGAGSSVVDTLTTSSSVLSTDAGIFFGAGRTTPPLTISPGNLLQTLGTSGANYGALYDLSMPGGVSNIAFSFPGAGAGFTDVVVIVEGVPSGVGSVTSVGLTVPSRQTVSGSPVTNAGTLAITDNTQSANLVFAGPSSGSAAAPTFRTLVSADVPSSLTNPMTTQGDIIYGGASGAPTRLAAGTTGQVLQTNGSSAAPSWVAAGGGGGGGASTPVIRGTAIQASSAASFTVSWPTGTIAGDLAIIFFAGGFDLSAIPTGWTQIDFTTGTNWEGATFYRFLSSVDITAGSIVLTPTGTFDAAIAIATIEGPSNAIRTYTVAKRQRFVFNHGQH
jgi:hypothetical protein